MGAVAVGREVVVMTYLGSFLKRSHTVRAGSNIRLNILFTNITEDVYIEGSLHLECKVFLKAQCVEAIPFNQRETKSQRREQGQRGPHSLHTAH